MNRNFPNFGHFILILIMFVAFSVPFGFLQIMVPHSWQAFFMLLGYVIPMLLTIWATRRAFDKKATYNFKPAYWYMLPLVIVTAYAFLVVGEFTVFLLPEPTGKLKKLFDMLNQTMRVIFEHKVIGFLMVAIAAPILEETLFRGIILKALLKKYKPWQAILYSAVAFGVFHLNPWQFLYATVLGLLLGYMYWRTRSLFYPVLIHFLLNGTAFLMGQYTDLEPNEGFSDYWTQHNMLQYYILVVISIGIIVMSYFWFEKIFRKAPQTLYLATQNPHKIIEIQKILPENIHLKSLQDLGFKGKLRETGKTLQANAIQKMRQISVPYDVDALADDTGLEVEALNGAPGVYSARYAGDRATYEENVAKLLEQMKGISNRKAKFKTVMALSKGHKEYLIEGEIHGTITHEPRGTNGFGYDSVFIPDGYNQTFAELTDEEKNKISHRAVALQKMKKLF